MDAPLADRGIVLAAGGSTRMGQPKALLDLDGEPLIRRHLAALRPWCRALRVVLGAHATGIAAALPDEVERRWNLDWASSGPRESLLSGLQDLDDQALVLVTPVDVPPAPPEVFSAILAVNGPAVPCYDNHDAHPVLVRVGVCRAALATGTLRDALAGATRVPVEWPDGLLNLNTPEEWARWRGR